MAFLNILACIRSVPDGAIRIFKDDGRRLDPEIGESNSFTVVEISNNKITQYRVIIKISASDADYINKLKDASQYRNADVNISIDLNGEFIEYSPTSVTQAIPTKTTNKTNVAYVDTKKSLLDA